MVVIRPERKYHDNNTTTLEQIPNTAITHNFNLVSQGSGVNNCVGLKFTVKSIQLRLEMILRADEEQTIALMGDTDFIHVAVVLDTQCNGTALAVTDVWDSALSNSLRNIAYEQRFKILKEEFINVTDNTLAYVNTDKYSATRVAMKVIDWYIPCNIRIDISSTGGSIGTMRSNNIVLVVRSQNNNFCSIVARSMRIRFTDV